MTEAEWLACATPQPMLEFLRDKAGDRKLRLFAAACCRRAWDHIGGLAQRAVDVAERYADGETAERDLAALAAEWHATRGRPLFDHDPCTQALASPDRSLLDGNPDVLARAVETAAQLVVSRPPAAQRRAAEEAAQAALLRDVFGMPHRPARLNRSWLEWNGATVGRIAKGIYEERRFQDLPLLADALLDAGCDNEELIEHCRSAGPHVRGCWALDLLLDKAQEAVKPTDKDFAEFALTGLRFQLLDAMNVDAWATALITACDDPPSWAMNLALADSRDHDAVRHALEAVPGKATPHVSNRLLVALMRRRWQSGTLAGSQVRGIAWPMSIEDMLPKPIGWASWGSALECLYEEVDQGHRTVDEMQEIIATYLAPYAIYEPLLPNWA